MTRNPIEAHPVAGRMDAHTALTRTGSNRQGWRWVLTTALRPDNLQTNPRPA